VFREYDKRIKVVLISQGMYTFVMQFLAQYNVLFAQALGANGTDIGLITLISGLVLCLSSPYLGLAVERCPIKRMMILGLILDLTAMIIFILASDWRWLIPAFILYGQLVRQMPIADMVFVTFVKPGQRATLVAVSRIFWGGIAIFAPLLSAAVVTYCGGINVNGIRPLYYISVPILSVTLLILYMGLDESSISGSTEKGKSSHEKTSLLSEYRKFLKSESYLKHWIAIRFFRDSSLGLLMTFVPLWIVNIKGATAAMLGILSTLSTMSGLLVQIPVGRLADRFGRKKAFLFFTVFYCAGLFLLAFAPSPEYLILAGVLGAGGIIGGGIGGAANTPLLTMWWESVPPESRGKLYGLEGIITAASRPLVIIGGILWDHDLAILIMLIPILVEIAIVVPLVCKIPETLKQ